MLVCRLHALVGLKVMLVRDMKQYVLIRPSQINYLSLVVCLKVVYLRTFINSQSVGLSSMLLDIASPLVLGKLPCSISLAFLLSDEDVHLYALTPSEDR